MIHIRNTLNLAEVEVSEACLAELKPQTRFETIKGPFELSFDEEGNLAGV